LRSGGYWGPVFGPATLLSHDLEEAGDSLGEVVVAAPYDPGDTDADFGRWFAHYVNETGGEPDAVAVFAYDAARAVIAAIETGGPNRVRIRDALAEKRFDGLVGSYRFDELGGTTLRPVVVRLGEEGWEKADDGR
jgi:ABC-type branched-subunit amino acid transport system substrate-binding protein